MATTTRKIAIQLRQIDATATAKPSTGPSTVQEGLPQAVKLMSASDCNACHKMDIKLVGPSYVEITKKYKDASTEEIEKLGANILNGSSGVWGQVAMPGHSTLKQADVEVMVKYILSLENS